MKDDSSTKEELHELEEKYQDLVAQLAEVQDRERRIKLKLRAYAEWIEALRAKLR